MPDLAAELYAVQHLSHLCTISITNIRDAKAAFGPTERGLDVICELNSRTIGVQHTIFHSDEGQTAGKRGSLARAREETVARSTQRPFGVWGVADYRPALALRLQEKCALAARYNTRSLVAETWLVVSACLPRWGAAASTTMLPGLVQAEALGGATDGLLRGSLFDRAYLVLHTDNIVFGWTRSEGWQLIADPNAQERERHREQMNDLIFNQIPAFHRRSTTSSQG